MAQSGFTPIVTYHSTTASAVPLAADLAPGELSLNINDMKLYCENSAGTVTLLASAAGATGTVSSVAVSGGTTGLTTSGGPITTTGTITLAGTLAVANGGTGVTTSTGTTNLVLSNSPTLVSPALGTPASGVVTNLTGTASININGTVGATTPTTGAFTTLSATGVATFAAGTVALPSITTTGDTNTGIYFPAADTVGITTGGAQRGAFSSTGLAVTGAVSASTVLQMPDGVVGTPGLRVGTSSTTGLFSSADNSLRVTCSGTQIGAFSSTGLAVTGAVSDSIGDVRSIIQNAKTAAYVLIATDNGKHISITTGGVTVNASIFSIGNVVTIFNNSGSNQTITQGASVTLRLAGTATTGNRTLAQYGVCTLLCVASNVFVISGGGLT